jgi:hypothetical protein
LLSGVGLEQTARRTFLALWNSIIIFKVK